MTAGPQYIESPQETLWGAKDPIGFGLKEKRVEIIPRGEANAVIVANHYSAKTATDAHNRLNLGVFWQGEQLGVIQYGYAMNPTSCEGVVPGTDTKGYLELNRMWLSDELPRQSASWALSYSIKLIRRLMPSVGWIQSFADERCGKLGAVYQASNFDYYGHHISRFWTLKTGEVVHNVIASNGARDRKDAMDMEGAEPMDLRQFRYVYWVKRNLRGKCVLTRQPYPKQNTLAL